MKTNLINKIFNNNISIALELMNPLCKLAFYRMSDMIDIDRSTIAKDYYESLGFIIPDKQNKLEPDTFFISAYNDIRLLLKRIDKERKDNYYTADYKRYIIENEKLDYDSLSDSKAKFYRYKWLTLPSTLKNYSVILENDIVLDYINMGHTLANFMVIPKGMGWYKTKNFEDKGALCLDYLKNNWDEYSINYGGIEYKQLLDIFKLTELVDNNLYVKEEYKIMFNTDEWENIFKKMEILIKYMKKRNIEIERELK